MNKTKYTIYWMLNGYPGVEESTNMSYVLKRVELLRKCPGYSAITFCSENTDQVGKPGVDAVVDGMLPDGLEYVYKTGRDRGRDPR